MPYAAGDKIPGKYPHVGSNYEQWGEQTSQGLIYDPYTDTYFYDPKKKEEYYQQTGRIEKPKDPSVLEQVGPIAGGMLALTAGKEIGEAVVPAAADVGRGLLGLGEKEAVGQATQQTTSSATGGLIQAGEGVKPATPNVMGAERGGQFTPGPGISSAEGAFANYGVPAIAAYSAGKMLEGGYSTLVKGEKPGRDEDIHFGLNPVTAWAYWPLKFLGVLGDKSTKQVQAERAKSLMDKGVQGFKGFYTQAQASAKDYVDKFGDKITNSYGARSDLDPEFVGIDEQSGRWINNKFANSGNVADLQAEDVWGSEGVFSTFGSDWLAKYTEDQRKQISQGLLNAGLFDTDKGDIIIKSDNQEEAKAIADSIINPKEEEDGNETA